MTATFHSALGTRSSRLLVSALQHDAGPPIAIATKSSMALNTSRRPGAQVSETPKARKGAAQPQSSSTHSPVVIRELIASDIFCCSIIGGVTTVAQFQDWPEDSHGAASPFAERPEASARKVLVGEGERNKALCAPWTDVAVSGRDRSLLRERSPSMAAARIGPLSLSISASWIRVWLLLVPKAAKRALRRATRQGAASGHWPDNCSTEQRLFSD